MGLSQNDVSPIFRTLGSSCPTSTILSSAITELRVAKKVKEQIVHYTYVLHSLSHPDQRYVGLTSNLRARLAKHNSGQVPHTSKFLPWEVETSIAFKTLAKAPSF